MIDQWTSDGTVVRKGNAHALLRIFDRPRARSEARMKALAQIAKTFGMTEEAWRRHANPWSVYTRFAAIPAVILAIWSRVWIGWGALVPVAGVILWLWLNPHVFPAVTTPRNWASRGIYGERLWL